MPRKTSKIREIIHLNYTAHVTDKMQINIINYYVHTLTLFHMCMNGVIKKHI